MGVGLGVRGRTVRVMLLIPGMAVMKNPARPFLRREQKKPRMIIGAFSFAANQRGPGSLKMGRQTELHGEIAVRNDVPPRVDNEAQSG